MEVMEVVGNVVPGSVPGGASGVVPVNVKDAVDFRDKFNTLSVVSHSRVEKYLNTRYLWQVSDEGLVRWRDYDKRVTHCHGDVFCDSSHRRISTPCGRKSVCLNTRLVHLFMQCTRYTFILRVNHTPYTRHSVVARQSPHSLSGGVAPRTQCRSIRCNRDAGCPAPPSTHMQLHFDAELLLRIRHRLF